MPAIITNSLRVLNADTFSNTISLQPTFLFIGKESQWEDEEFPEQPYESDKERVQVFKDILAVKRIQPGNINSVVPRINWVSGAVYDQYDDRINMIDSRKSNGSKYRYYVLTDEFNVYKCLANNGGEPSTSKPTSQQITDFQTPDGYVWKYMYTVRSADVFNFMTDDWIPVYTVPANDGSSQWQVQRSAVDGAIHNVSVEIEGAGYNPGNPPVLTVVGDGTGAEILPIIDPATGAISGIQVVEQGSGYTTAEVVITNVGAGAGAMLVPIISPPGGHGKDARQELGAVFKMIKLSLAGTESGAFPTTSFRRAGLITKPLCTEKGSVITLESTNGFSNGDIITGSATGATGVIRLVDTNGRLLWIDSVVGDFIQAESVEGSAGVVQQIQSVDNDVNIVLTDAVAGASKLIPRTGEILYISNREAVNRPETQTQDVRFILQF